jgi:hypothetical protein
VYETAAPAEPGEPGEQDRSANQFAWSSALYVETANALACPGDVLVSFDNYALSLDEQIRTSWPLYDHIAVSGIRRSLLVHPNETSPHDLVNRVHALAPNLDLLGVTEKDIGPPWFAAVTYVQALRYELDAAFDRYVPLHIFGCLDPQTIPYLFFAGADVFDGLAWMRYYFRNQHAYYAKEYEYELEAAALLDTQEVARGLLAHNVEELELLRADLRYAVLTGDIGRFETPIRALQAIEGIP